MNSILHNSAALSALQTLNLTQQALATTQNQVSSGLAVANASDNAAYWSIATQLNADFGMVSAANSAISQGQAVLSTASTAISSIITTINAIQTALTEAASPGQTSATYANINTTLASLGSQLTDAVNGASFNGANALDGSQGATASLMSFVSGFNGSPSVNNVTTINLTLSTLYGGPTAASAGGGILGAATGTTATAGTYDLTTLGSSTTVTSANAQDILTAVNAALTGVTTYSAQLGATQDRMSSMNNLNSALNTNYATGVEGLVDADMNMASTRLQALQTQQQLGIQSLSIANQNAQLIMKLFG